MRQEPLGGAVAAAADAAMGARALIAEPACNPARHALMPAEMRAAEEAESSGASRPPPPWSAVAEPHPATPDLYVTHRIDRDFRR